MARSRQAGIAALLLTAAAAFHWALAQPPAATPAPIDLAKSALDSYAKALNDRNADAVTGFWADNAEHINDEGAATVGKANIGAMFKKVLAEHPKLTVKLAATNAKLLGNDVLLIDGTAEVDTGDGPELSTFESLWVRNGATWQISRVRELPAPAAHSENNFELLKQLDWLVGEWSSETAAYAVHLTIKWSKNKNFLLLEQAVKANGQEAVTVHKIIGWDPQRGQIRTWIFDSDGGFGGGLVSRSGNTWIEESESVTRSGSDASATQMVQFIDDNSFEWTSTQRQLDEKPLPDLKLKYTRKTSGK